MKQLKLPAAVKLSQDIAEILTPMCSRILVVGSVRRTMPVCNDIDIVVLPKPGMANEIRARVKSRSEIITDGLVNLIVRLRNQVQLDVFFAHDGVPDMLAPQPSNWGTMVLCRTGPKEFNIRLANMALKAGMNWEPMRGLIESGNIIAGKEEPEILEKLGLGWVEPYQRR